MNELDRIKLKRENAEREIAAIMARLIEDARPFKPMNVELIVGEGEKFQGCWMPVRVRIKIEI